MSVDQLTRIEQKIDKLDTLITGGENPRSGIIVRLDRVEQTEIRRNVWTVAAIGASAAALVSAAYKWATHSGGASP